MTSNQQIAIQRTTEVERSKKVEVSIDGDRAVIRMSTYADDIGWFVQKTITVDADMLDAMSEQLTAARGEIKREGDEILSADLLEFE